MTTAHNRVAVLHGVNFDVLERREPELYGGLSLFELERRIETWARELGLETLFFQTNALQAGGSVLDVAAIVALIGWTILELVILGFIRVPRPGEDV